MTPKRPLARFAPLLVFLLGAAFGIATSALFVSHHLRNLIEDGPHEAVRFATIQFSHELDLDDAQLARFQPRADHIIAAFDEMHVEHLARVRILFESTAADLRPYLRPEQQKRLDELLIDPRRRWNKFLGPADASGLPPAPSTDTP